MISEYAIELHTPDGKRELLETFVGPRHQARERVRKFQADRTPGTGTVCERWLGPWTVEGVKWFRWT